MSQTVEATTGLSSTLAAGVAQISGGQAITFTKYIRVVLPIDGFVFWVSAILASASAQLNASALNSLPLNQNQTVTQPTSIIVTGSLHYATTRGQNEDETIDVNRVVFTATSQIESFNQTSPNVMYLGEFNNIRFSFSARQQFYQQSGLYHYTGEAVYPEMEPQIIDALEGFDTLNAVVSNSLPIWLAMDQMAPPFPYPASQTLPLYPSFAVPANLAPPYGAVHIAPTDTRAIQATAFIDSEMNHWQLVEDTVKVTFYGARNFNVMDFIDYVNNLSLQDDSPFGIMNMPIPRDEKRTQVELGILAQKKTVEFRISYYQARARAIARQLILTVIPSYTF